ncbi:MAG: type III-B CRISPR module RAMP protein Cmr6, partial [Verrucomicrobiae bacterium]|nr:type III-B CRISPR module RAMP protein Cmr6 [Verrucomicrobiae bacterium]
RESAGRQAGRGGANAEAYTYKAQVAGALAGVRVDNPSLAKRQVENSLQMLGLLEKSYAGRSVTLVGQLGGRLLINMAGGVQENAGLALDRCFGLPFLPGSAVKGVTRHAALWDIRTETDPRTRATKLRLAMLAFGFIGQDIGPKGDFAWAAQGDRDAVLSARDSFTRAESFRGVLSFLPAYPTSEPRIVAEVLTPHPRADRAASGKDEPRPLFFPAVAAGSSFGFAILATWRPANVDFRELLDQAGEWLRSAITTTGIGAKTGAGYGWFVIDPAAEEARRREMAELEERARQKAEEEVKAAA